MHQKHLFWHSMWSSIIFEKSLFLHPVDLVEPLWPPPLGLPSTACCSPLGLGTGV